ncbi:uncharacterized protein LOC131235705 isoform X2 [Magnolia sinica]|uniref:uncharacterized protein LOC131235705 isoform X2 n=1 Tax=Magnolia sinica TaxID=86752 RepID=UPI00265AC51F|nr:uncharacterized protein LOC131235705 isoform X2 [Magnolia sinica]
MNTRVRTTLQTMKAPLELEKKEKKKEKMEMQGNRLMESKKGKNQCCSRRERKMALQQDVDKLKKKLRHEENVHRALERAFTRPLGALPRLPPYLPSYTLELLAEVAVLEEEVVRLEELVVNFRQGLYQEAVHISSSKKNIENAIDFCDQNSCKNLKPEQPKPSYQDISESLTSRPLPSTIDNHSVSKQLSSDVVSDRIGHCSTRPMNGKQPPRKLHSCSALSEDGRGKENKLHANSTKNGKQLSPLKASRIRTSVKRPLVQPKSVEKPSDPLKLQLECRVEKERPEESSPAITSETASEGKTNDPNKVSEVLLKCLSSIFFRMSTPKTTGMEFDMLTSISELSSCECSVETEFLDPYGICSEFGRRDIGPYKHLIMIQASSTDPNRVTNTSFLVRRLKLLLEKLSSVDLRGLTHQQKLAFWINIYNSCMMTAFLEHGIPGSPQTVAALMQKAMINVGGYVLNAMTIEHFILRLPYQSKCAYTKCVKIDEVTMRRIFGLDWPEPLVTFALSCGSWSSPAVRVYTASQVEMELQAAKRDYLQAAVGISTTKLAIPKLLDWYLLDFAKDIESLLDWVCLQLPSELRKEAIKCLEIWRQDTVLQYLTVIPYDFNFRYLLAP